MILVPMKSETVREKWEWKKGQILIVAWDIIIEFMFELQVMLQNH